MSEKCLAVLVAAGEGRRLGWPAGKALAPLAGLPLFMHALRTLWDIEQITDIALVLRAEDRTAVEELLKGLPQRRGPWSGQAAGTAHPDEVRSRVLMAQGGATRQASALRGLEALVSAGGRPDDVVIIHDAARPLATAGLFRLVAAAAAAVPVAVAPGLPVVDSLRAADEAGTTRVARDGLFRVQTPQACLLGPLLDAHRAAAAGLAGPDMTGQDDLSVAEAHGIGVLLVPGEERNLKVTHSGDLTLAGDLITAGRQPRVGLGFDVHPLREGHGVRLGGVLIRCPYELEGHSDADVIAHAAMDALLGAAGGGDIGLMFPPGDERWRNADSIKLLESVWQRLASQGYLAGNVDITVLAETPRLSPHFHDMQRCLAGAIQCEPWRVNVKATTTEKLGSIGRAEGIAAMAVAMLYGPGGQSATTTPAS